MINKFNNLAVVMVTTTLSITMVELASVQAADFASFIFSLNSVYGELSFNNTLLTGIDIEKASLSQLSNESGFNFWAEPYEIYPSFNGFTVYNPENYQIFLAQGNPVFTFSSGELIGIEFSEEQFFVDSNPEADPYNPVPNEYLNFSGSKSLDLLGDRYEASLEGWGFFTSSKGYPAEYIYDEEGNVIDIIYQYDVRIEEVDVTDSGAILFDTIDPIEAIPEPLTMVGTGTAIALGTFFKRQLSKKSKKDNIKA